MSNTLRLWLLFTVHIINHWLLVNFYKFLWIPQLKTNMNMKYADCIWKSYNWSEWFVCTGVAVRMKWRLLTAYFSPLSLFSCPYFSPRSGCPTVLKFCTGPEATKILGLHYFLKWLSVIHIKHDLKDCKRGPFLVFYLFTTQSYLSNY